MTNTPDVTLNPGRIHQLLTSYQLAMAVKGAIDLDLFTHVAAGATTVPSLASRCRASEKGIRVLCDYLTVHGLLTKTNGAYAVSPDIAPLLDRASTMYMGSVAGFFTHPAMIARYNDVAALVRNGGAIDHTLAPNDEIWVEFARRMAPMFALPARTAASLLAASGAPMRVLDIAAGHGLFGIEIALINPQAEVTFQDWPNVLEVTREHAIERGLSDRFELMPGNAFEVDFGHGYDLALLPNFLHHFDHAANIALLNKVCTALEPDGRVAIIEFVPNEDRISPPDGALFAMRMLGTTPSGDAYTLAEFQQMLGEAGFDVSDVRRLSPAPQTLIVANRTSTQRAATDTTGR